MMKNPETYHAWRGKYLRDEGPLPFGRAMKLFESLWAEAVELGRLPPEDPLEGIEVDIKIAELLGSCSQDCSPR